jgi:hypothetical protein
MRGRGRWLLAYAVAEISIPFPLIAAGEVHVPSSLAAIIVAASSDVPPPPPASLDGGRRIV